MPSISKIKSKISKLIALSNSPNKAEAESATNKYKRLLEKYDIDIVNIQESDCNNDYLTNKEVPGSERLISQWEIQLAAIIAEFFEGSAIVNRKYGKWSITFIAGKAEVHLISALFKKLRNSISKLSYSYTDNPKNRHSYQFGLLSVLHKRLETIYTMYSEGKGLIVCKDNMIQTYTLNKYGIVSSENTMYWIYDEKSYLDGTLKGYNISIETDIKKLN